MITLSINGQPHDADVPSDMPLLWVLRDVIGLTGTKFGFGLAPSEAAVAAGAGALGLTRAPQT